MVYIGVSSHQKFRMQIHAFSLLWKDDAYPDYDEAFVSTIPDALPEEGIALRVSMIASPSSYLINLYRLLCMR